MSTTDPNRTGRKTVATAVPTAPPIAHKLSDLVRQGPFGHTKLYELIKTGVLPAYQLGGSTLVKDEDWRALFDNLPRLEIRKIGTGRTERLEARRATERGDAA